MTIITFPHKEGACCVDTETRPTILTLPVASRQLHRIRFDQPDVQARAVPPAGALNWLEEHIKQGVNIWAVNIEGPGDPLGEIEETLETLKLVSNKFPEIKLTISTLGIFAEQHAKSLTQSGISGVTLLVNAVTQEAAEKLYAWIRPGSKTIPLDQAANMLLLEQLLAVKSFKKEGCRVTIRSTVYPGFNDSHMEEIARVMARAGAEAMEITPCKRTADPDGLHPAPPDLETLLLLQQGTEKYLNTTLTAIQDHGIGVDCSSLQGTCRSMTTLKPGPTKKRPKVAVVSSNEMEVDLHLGQAYQVLIYGPREDGLACLLETRHVPEPGSSNRWDELAERLHDCFAVLTASAGESPRKILGRHGITVIITDSEIEATVDVLYGGGKKGGKKNLIIRHNFLSYLTQPSGTAKIG